MRISDWSSDVCSSDLLTCDPPAGQGTASCAFEQQIAILQCEPRTFLDIGQFVPGDRRGHRRVGTGTNSIRHDGGRSALVTQPIHKDRSEEHTSELQSLMRISYAVFCLKKKTKPKRHKENHQCACTDQTHAQIYTNT